VAMAEAMSPAMAEAMSLTVAMAEATDSKVRASSRRTPSCRSETSRGCSKHLGTRLRRCT
jgi:hypothetical protein